jgi:peptidoglycan/LPS O-acetylase OafA/YrhL
MGPEYPWAFWSLAVEEQFYFAWPLCVWLLAWRNLAKLAVAGSVIALLVRMFWIAHPGSEQAIAMATVTRMDSLLCGALGAMLIRDTQALNIVRKWLPGVALIAILFFVGGGGLFRIVRGHRGHFLFIETFGFSFLALGFSSLIVYSAATDGIPSLLQHVLRNRVLTDFGKYSYGIYVYHVPISGVLDYLLHKGLFKSFASGSWFGASCFAFLLATSFFAARISYECFERYFIGLKHYFEARTDAEPHLAAEIVQ